MIKRILKRIYRLGRPKALRPTHSSPPSSPPGHPDAAAEGRQPNERTRPAPHPQGNRVVRHEKGTEGPPHERSARHAPQRERHTDGAAPRRPSVVSQAWDPAVFQVPAQKGLTRFHDLNLRVELMHAIHDLGFQYCTPVQAETLPAALASRDVSGRAQTGTGKTAAFLIRIFQHMLTTPGPANRQPGTARALVLAPTRELAMQIERDAKALGKYCPFHTVALYGGEEVEKQRRAVSGRQPDLIIATPGRLLDFKNRRHIFLGQVEILVIDEADRMLDMGFIPDVRSIVFSTPRKEQRQTLMFSATLTEMVTRLAASWTREPVRVDIDPGQVAVNSVKQIVYIVTSREKFALLYNILKHEHLERVLLFANRRDTAARLAHELQRYGIDCALISGALPQQKRSRTLESFREGRVRIMVATDVASRGLHIDGVGHVINYNVPVEPDDYVHRIGRTGRAGATGTSVTFASEDESMYLPDIEKFIGNTLACTRPPDEWLRIPSGVKPLNLPYESAAEGKDRRPGGARTPSGGHGRPQGRPRR